MTPQFRVFGGLSLKIGSDATDAAQAGEASGREDDGRLWQPYADSLVYVALMALPWGGMELCGSAAADTDRLLEQMQAYMEVRGGCIRLGWRGGGQRPPCCTGTATQGAARHGTGVRGSGRGRLGGGSGLRHGVPAHQPVAGTAAVQVRPNVCMCPYICSHAAICLILNEIAVDLCHRLDG